MAVLHFNLEFTVQAVIKDSRPLLYFLVDLGCRRAALETVPDTIFFLGSTRAV